MSEMALADRYVEKTRTWNDDWNNVIRTVFFKDEKLKELMCIPEGTAIIPFITKYFIEDAAPDAILTNELVRVNHYDTQGYDTGNKNVVRKYKEFDIYVKESVLYDATNDRLKARTQLIAERIKYLLLRRFHICELHFDYRDEYDLWTKTVGYKRYHIVFSYRISV